MKPTSVTRRAIAPLATATALVALLAVPASSGAPSSGMAWIDDPLPSAHLPAASVIVTAHATDRGGVARMQFYVDGVLTADTSTDPTAHELTVATFRWPNPAPGDHYLMVRGKGADGGWGRAAGIYVYIGDGQESGGPSPSATPSTSVSSTPTPSPTPTLSPSRTPAPTASRSPSASPTPTVTPTPTPTPTPTATPTPSPTACSPAAPVLLRPGSGAIITDPAANPPTLGWAYRVTPSCPPSGFRVQIATDSGFSGIVASGTVGASVFSYTPGTLADCTTYYWNVTPLRGDRQLGSPTSTWSFQIHTRCRV